MMRRLVTIVLLLVSASILAGDARADDRVFHRENLRGAQFTECDLQRAIFRGSRLPHARFIDITRSPRITFRDSHLEETTFEYARLSGPRVTRSRIEGLEGYDFTLDDWDVRQSRWTKLTLRHCTLRYINLERTQVRDFRAEWGDFRGSRWRGTDLRESEFDNCDLSRSSFSRGSLERSRFQNVSFRDVRLEGCDIRGLVINGVRIDELLK